MLAQPPSIVGAEYDGAVHCVAHAEERFGMGLYGRVPPEDEAGSSVRLISTIEDARGETCSDCGRELKPSS